jgi:AcrR family transcriptional regulator
MEKAPRPLRRDAEANRRRILEAARTVFAREGFDAAMEEVARTAGCGIGTLYRRFPSKDALVREQFDEMRAEMLADVEDATANPDALAGLTHLLTQIGRRIAANRGLHEAIAGLPQTAEAMEKTRAALTPAIAALLARARASGQVRDDIDEADVPVLVSMVAEAIAATEDAGADLWPRYVVILLDGLRPGGTPLPRHAPSPEEVDRIFAAKAARLTRPRPTRR